MVSLLHSTIDDDKNSVITLFPKKFCLPISFKANIGIKVLISLLHKKGRNKFNISF